jgi:hypothetical protein
VLKLSIEIQTVMFQRLLLLVILPLRLQRVSDGDDPVKVVPPDLKITAFHIFISAIRPILVVLEPTFVFFFIVVIGQVYAGEDESGVEL